jgi:hypothetical protein
VGFSKELGAEVVSKLLVLLLRLVEKAIGPTSASSEMTTNRFKQEL